MDKTLKIGDEEFAFDVFDIDFMERFAPAERRFLKAAAGAPGNDDLALMKKQVEAGYALLDEVWGAGTAERVFAGKRKLDAIFAAYSAMVSLASAQNDALADTAGLLQRKISELTDR